MKRLSRFLAVITLVSSTGSLPVAACTVCSSENGLQVRQEILGNEFKPAVIATIAPFAILAATVAAISAFPALSDRRSREKNL